MADSAERYNSVLEIINERLIPDATAKEARGEVFTPLNLVREILFGIRKSAIDKGITEIWGIDKEGNFFDDNEDDRVGGIPLSIWRNPQTKWLDPTNGIGNFPVVAFYMLDYQLGKHGPKELRGNEHKLRRRNHIVEKMLYMIELDKGNVNTARKIFKKIVPGVTPNIICANTLEMTDERLNAVFKGVNRFDVVMGNPPFQDDTNKRKDSTLKNKNKKNNVTKKTSRKGGKNKLYERITLYCMNILSPSGLLLFITPDNIFSGNALDIYTKFIEKHVIFLNLNKIKARYFPKIGQSMCYFILENNNKKAQSLIINSSGIFRTTLQNRSINPIKEWNSRTEALIAKYISNKRNNFKYNRGTTESDYKGGNIEVIYTPEQKLKTSNPSLAPAYGAKYKVILFESKPRSKPVYDKDGKYGVGPHTFYYISKSDTEAEKLITFLSGKEYDEILNVVLTGQYLKTSFIMYLNIEEITK
jgi:hypothetical protein